MPTYTDTQKFLQAVFGADYGTRAILANLNPAVHVRSVDQLDPLRDCYWSVAAFAPGHVECKKTRALGVRALVVDDVGTKVKAPDVLAALGAPTAIVETSAGNFQFVYRLSAEVPVDQWGGFFAGVEALVGQKLEGRDAVHLFRLPMGVNTKKGRGGFAVRPVKVDPRMELNVNTLTQNLPAAGPVSVLSGPEPRIKNIRKFMALIPNNDVDYDAWISRAHQIKALALDEAEGEKAFDEWSSKSGKYDAGETARRWATVSPSRTAGLDILRDAEAADPAGFAKVMNAEAASVFDDGVAPPPLPFGGGGGGAGPTHKIMAEDIVRAEAGRLGWLNGRSGSWAMFDDVMRCWVISSNDASMHRAVEDAVNRYLGGGGVSARTAAMLHKAGWHHSVASLVRVKTELRLEPEVFDANDDLLGLPGSVLEMAAGGLGLTGRAGRPGDFITRSTSTKAAAPGARGKYWEKFLDDFTQKDPGLRAWWQAFCGYCLSGHTGEHVVVFVYGPGGNGKSVFLDMIGEVMGDYHERADHRVFMESKGGKHLSPLAVLEGARLVTVPDVSVGATWDMGLVKQASGGGAITANRMRQDPCTYIPRFKIVMAGNEKPRLDTVDDGVRRRMRLVPALFRPKAVDTGLVDKLRGEKAEILRWMVDGWAAWAASGLPACPTIDAATSDYLDAADVFGRWVGEALAAKGGGKARIKEAFGSWEGYKAADGSYSSTPNSVQQMAAKLKDVGFTVKRDMVSNYVEGFEVLNINSKGVF